MKVFAALLLLSLAASVAVGQHSTKSCDTFRPDPGNWRWLDRDCKEHTRKELDDILERHRKWLGELKQELLKPRMSILMKVRALTDHRRADLSGATLIDANFYYADLAGANLSRADLTNADLGLADVTKASLKNADLTGTVFIRADLTGAILDHATLSKADLNLATLSEADLKNADLTGVDLSEANLTKANLSEADLTSSADLGKADLTGAILKHANLAGGSLSGASLNNADLSNADLTGAILEDADLTGADLSNADLTGAILENADLTGADLFNAELAGSSLAEADLSSANLTDSDMSNADVTETVLRNATFEPKIMPPIRGIARANGLDSLTWKKYPYSVIDLRNALHQARYTEAEAEVNLAFHRRVQTWYERPLDWTCAWGVHWARPIWITLLLAVFCSIYYWALLRFFCSRLIRPQGSSHAGRRKHSRPKRPSGLYVVARERGREREWPVGATVLPLPWIFLPSPRRRLWIVRLPFDLLHSIHVRLHWEMRLYRTALQLSLKSVLNLGVQGLDLGRWLWLMQRRDYDLRARGTLRMLTGIQSVLSFLLLALAAYNLFVQPIGE